MNFEDVKNKIQQDSKRVNYPFYWTVGDPKKYESKVSDSPNVENHVTRKRSVCMHGDVMGLLTCRFAYLRIFGYGLICCLEFALLI